MDLIRRDQAVAVATECGKYSVAAMIQDNIPAVDAVEVVRCKDCKFSEHWYRDHQLCTLWSEGGIGVFDDGFCNYGEKDAVEVEMTYEQNVRAILESNFAESKDEIIDIAVRNIMALSEDRPKGKWINAKVGRLFPSDDFKCSICGNIHDFDGLNCGRGDANFCPNCGADMRGE